MSDYETVDQDQSTRRVERRRKKRDNKELRKVGWLGYTVLIFAVLATFGSLLGTDLLWTEYDQVQRSPFTAMESPDEVQSIELLRNRSLVDTLSYFAESNTSLPVAQLHRGINLLLHLTAAIFLLRVLQNLNLTGAFAATLVFALHPAVVQPIFWPGYRAELFGLVLILAALDFGLRSRNPIEYLLALMLTLAACFVHKAGLAIPVVLALMIYLQKGSIHLNEYNRVLPMVCIALFTGAWIHAGVPAEASQPGAIYEAINHAGQNLAFFYKQALVPASPALFHPYDSYSAAQTSIEFSILPFCVLIPFYAVALFKFRTGWSRGLLIGLTAFILLLLPGINARGFNIDGSPAHETYGLYIALPAILALIVAGSRSVLNRVEFAGKGLWFMALGLIILIEITLSAAFSYALGNPVRMWQLQAEQWPKQWIPQVALINYAADTNELEFSQSELIRKLEELLERRPELIDQRRILVRSYVAAGQRSNALREYRRILRESEPNEAFLSEAADFFDRMGFKWEANNARKRMQSTPTPDS